MKKRCPKCHRAVRELARYCARCGQSLGEPAVAKADDRAGLTSLPAPEDFSACESGSRLYYKWESGWGGRSLLGTEPLAVWLYNAGEAINGVELEVTALDAKEQPVAKIHLPSVQLPRGETIRVEVPSYEIPDEVYSFAVALPKGRPAEQSR